MWICIYGEDERIVYIFIPDGTLGDGLGNLLDQLKEMDCG